MLSGAAIRGAMDFFGSIEVNSSDHTIDTVFHVSHVSIVLFLVGGLLLPVTFLNRSEKL